MYLIRTVQEAYIASLKCDCIVGTNHARNAERFGQCLYVHVYVIMMLSLSPLQPLPTPTLYIISHRKKTTVECCRIDPPPPTHTHRLILYLGKSGKWAWIRLSPSNMGLA